MLFRPLQGHFGKRHINYARYIWKWYYFCPSKYMMRYINILILLVLPVWVADSTGLLVVAPNVQVSGVDVSRHQKLIEWDTVAAHEPVQFAFVKATEGGDYRDSLFCYNWESLDRLNIRRGAYHFFRGYGCGIEQATHFLSTVEMKPGDLPPVLDLETLDNTPPEQVVEEAKIWLAVMEQALGIKPIIYTNQHFYERFLADNGFDGYPLWIARYSDQRPNLTDGNRWSFWQYTKEGCVEGISEKVDMNVFPGTVQMLDEMCWNPAPSVVLP